MKDAVEEWPQTLKALMIWTYVQVAQPILDMSEGRRVAWFIATINGAVYIAWQFPRLKPFMTRHFTHDPLSGLSYTLLTSMFSHRSLLHLLVNSMILSTFGSATTQWFAEETQKDSENLRESTSKWHFIAFFISAGLFSGLVSHIVSARVTFPRLVSRLTSSTAPGNSKTLTASITKNRPFKNAAKEQSLTIPPSLGSSGAVYSTLVVVAMAYPDTELALKIPPAFPIPIQYGVGTLLAVDILGALRGWRYFNHWAHLGGAAFGAFYWEYGFELWDLLRVITLGNLPPSLSKTQVQ
ncbi:hypothetical protein AcV7_009521 [Taiwanofungus camphoratus]|nr:hypothetical protein AcV7_009521 [Antrodia cinnamomea]